MARLPSLLVSLMLLSSPACAQADDPVKIYIFAGQSNMVGPGDNAALAELAPELQAPREDVWCVFSRHVPGPLGPGFGFRPGNFGPELRLGHVLGDAIEAPVILFKSGLGGKTLQRDFRPPSAVARAGGQVGPLYEALLRRFHNLVEHLPEVYPAYAGQGFEVAGFIWFQGENDCVAFEDGRGVFEDYEANLRDLIADVRHETGIADLPVIIVQINDSGAWDGRGGGPVVRAAQQRVADETEGVTWVRTDDLDPGYHYDSASHLEIGQRIGDAALAQLRQGIEHSDGRVAAAAEAFGARSRPPPQVDPELAVTLREGLYAYWNFDEGEGKQAVCAISGRAAGFRIESQEPQWVAGLHGNALHFAESAALEVPGFALPSEDGEILSFSLSCWVAKTSKRSGTYAARQHADAGWSWGEAFNEGWPLTRLSSGEESFEEHGGWSSLLTTGDGFEWRHVVVVFDAATERLEQYLNGVLVAHRRVKSESGEQLRAVPTRWRVVPAAADIPLVIGHSPHTAGHGQSLDELGIWSRALEPAEIAGLFAGGHGWVPTTE